MTRRAKDEKITHARLDPVATGILTALVTPDSGTSLSPRSLNYYAKAISSSGSISLAYYSELTTGSVVFWKQTFPITNFGEYAGTISTPPYGWTESEQFPFPAQFEVPKGSGIAITAIDTQVSFDLYYVAHDVAAGITDVAARAVTYQAHLVAPKAIRTPNRFGGQVEG